jgi:eukaryotic-like serine/threonine-protein kinase
VSLLVDRYELGETLGTGGMSTVVAGHDQVLDRPVAIKLLGQYQQPDARARLLREARAAARLHHPNVVAVYDTGEHDGRPFIVMELVRGRTLADELRARGPLEIEEAVGLALGILDGLAVAHTAGIVHRDVKPGNVLLPDAGGAKLSDFGIAKALEDATAGLTATGTVLGTPNYLAPELISGGTAGPGSDVYSVGCVLFELLTGQPPYTGESSVAIAYAHVHQPVPEVTDLRPEVPRDLATVVTTAMAKDPGERYPDAAAMRAALLDGPSAAPASAPARTAVLPPVSDSAPTEPLAGATAAAATAPRPGAPRWLVPMLVGVVALVGLWLVADASGLIGGDEPDVAGADDTETDDTTDGGEGVPVDEPEPTEPERTEPDDGTATEPPTEGEPTETEPTETEPTEEDPATEPPVEPAEPETLDELIVLLAASPAGTYGEKQGDLLEDLMQLRDEQAPGQRAQEAAAIREEVEDYVAAGELDPEVGRYAIAVLSEIAAHTGN